MSMKPNSSAGQILQDSNPILNLELKPRQESTGFDPLQASTRLHYSRTFFPLGFPAQIRSNDASVLEAAELSWGLEKQRFHESPVELRVIVAGQQDSDPSSPVFRAQGNLMSVVADANNFGSCDLEKGFGFAYVTPGALTAIESFRYHFLEGIIYTLLDSRHLTTVHAACVSRAGQGVLLAGESGAGKSSFAYACTQRGWTYVCDDACSLVNHRNDRKVIGNSRSIRFRPSVTSLFPELGGHVRNRNGKPTLELKTSLLPRVQPGFECDVSRIVFLNRRGLNPGSSSLTPISRADCFHRLTLNPWPSELPIHQNRQAALQRLCTAPAFELIYQNFDPAIEALERLVGTSEVS